MIYVTHDQVEAMTMGSRICIMNGGQIAQVGQPLDVYNRPANTFVAAFLGNPAMNLLPAEVAGGNDGRLIRVGETLVVFPAARSSELRPGQKVTLGIRPEHLRLDENAGPNGLLSGQVVGLERLGAETLVAVLMPSISVPVLAQIVGQSGISLGDRINVTIALEHVHLFDVEGFSLTFPAQKGA